MQIEGCVFEYRDAQDLKLWINWIEVQKLFVWEISKLEQILAASTNKLVTEGKYHCSVVKD